MHVELCAGIGGLALALGGADEFWEIDPAPAEVLSARFPEVPLRGDWTELDSFGDDVTVVSGGLPCQPISGAGRGRGDADERYLFDHLVRILGASQARPTLHLENVRGILYPRNRVPLARFLRGLADLGYVARWECVRASDIGAPHRRERWFCTARHPDGELAGWQRGTLPRAQTGSDGEGVFAGDSGDGSADAVADPAHADGTRLQGHGAERGLGEGSGEVEADGGGQAARHPDGFGFHGTGARGAGRQPNIGQEQPGVEASRRSDAGGCDMGAGGGPGTTGPAGVTVSVAGQASSQQSVGASIGGDGDREGVDEGSDGSDGLARLRSSKFGPAVELWEQLTRPCPAPLDGARLSVGFVEWMLGYPDGWCTDILGRTAALKALGNSVQPQQAALAFAIINGGFDND